MSTPSADHAPTSHAPDQPRGGASRHAGLRRLSPIARTLTVIAFWGNLISQIGIIITGAIVRLSKSGLGCSTWPNCEPGQFTPRYHPDLGIRPFIEFGNRMLTGVLLFFAVAVIVTTVLWLKHKGRGFIALATIPIILTLVQAIVGMAVVVLELHPAWVSIHFLVSPILVFVSAVLTYRLYDGDDAVRPATAGAVRSLFWPMGLAGYVILILGTVVTGSGPHSGDANTTSRYPINPRDAAWLHADVVMLFIGLLMGLLVALYASGAHRPAKRAAAALVVLTVLQAILGYSQYILEIPELLVGLHMTGAALFSGGLAWVGASLYTWNAAGTALRDEAELKEQADVTQHPAR